MNISIQDNQGVEEWRVAIKGCFDFEIARGSLAEMREQSWNGRARLIFDLTEVPRIESAGMGAMLLLIERMPSSHRPVIRCAHHDVWNVLQIAHMERFFELQAAGGLAEQLAASQAGAATEGKARARLNPAA